MKTQLTITLFALLLACTGCSDLTSKSTDKPQPTLAMSVIGDLTDKNLMQEKPEDIESFLPIHNNTLYDGYLVRTRAIDESEKNEITQYEVKPQNYWTGEEQARIGELKTLKAQVGAAIERLEEQEIKPRKASRVYEAVCGELVALKTANPKEAVVVILSDMLQNEPGNNFSFYRKADYDLAMKNPEAAAAKLQQIMPMPKMNGPVRVYIIHKVQSYDEQKLFDCAIRVWVLMLTNAGCKVYVMPNIINT